MSGETETVALNLDGDFASAASAAAAAGDKLDGSLGALEKQKGPTTATEALRKLTADAKTATSALDKLRAAAKEANGGMGKGFGGGIPTALMGSPKAPSGFNQIVQAVGKLFGGGAAGGLVSGAAALSRVEDKLAPFGLSLADAGGVLKGAGGMLVGAGGAVLKAGTVVLEAALALTAAAVALGAAGYKFGVEQTTKKQAGEAVLGKQGFAMSIGLAAKYNLDEGDAVKQVKRLLNAKFSQAEIPALIRIKAGMDAAGLNGDEVLGKLETMKLKPKVDAKDVKALAGMGVDTNAVYAQLAKQLGITMPAAMAKVRAGTADTGQVIKAVEAATGQQFGKLADQLGNSVPGLLNKIRLAFGELFADMDLGPLKDFLKSVLGALSGGAGGELKAALKDLFSAISHTLFDPFKGAEGQKKLENMLRGLAAVAHDVAGVVTELAPLIRALVSALGSTGEGGMKGSIGLGVFEGAVMYLLGPLGQLIDILRVVSALIDVFGGGKGAGAGAGPVMPTTAAQQMAVPGDDASAGGVDVGSALSDGIVAGIAGGESGAIAAAVDLVTNAIAAAHAAADAHSPSRKMGRLGGFMGQGVTIGMQAENDNAAAAGADVAKSAMRGAASGAGAGLGQVAGARGGGAKGGGDTYNVQIMQPPGATKKEGEEFATGFNKRMRELHGEAA